MTDLLTLEILTQAYRMVGEVRELLRGDGITYRGHLAYKYSLQSIISTISQLIENGDVIFYRRLYPSREEQLYSLQEVETVLQEIYQNEFAHSPMCYVLTEQGGKKWEEIFQADLEEGVELIMDYRSTLVF
jgi:hypothetical protein